LRLCASAGGKTDNVTVLLIILFTLILYGIYERWSHLRNLKALPIRIHVNGTRGKSSVTRLIAAGLRAGGKKTFAKTTGTKPRMIFEDGTEAPILRPGKANIIEQIGVVRRAARRKPEALVIECMAVNPVLQRFVEEKLVRSTIGVITNVREDHVDVMGPTIQDIARSLTGTMPRKGPLFTAEQKMLPVIQEEAKRVGVEVVTSDQGSISDEIMGKFSYVEHKENVALSLKVMEHLGISRDVALGGMYAAEPDPGALRRHRIEFFGKEIEFVNAFAANDRESISLIWNGLVGTSAVNPDNSPKTATAAQTTIVIVTCREDRLDRSKQMGELIAEEIKADFYVLNGALTNVTEKQARASGLSADRLFNLNDSSADRVFGKIVELTSERSLVLGIGNIVGYGEAIVACFESKSLATPACRQAGNDTEKIV
jgi:poly-gamma-glutamate synthase PgsB/CapB